MSSYIVCKGQLLIRLPFFFALYFGSYKHFFVYCSITLKRYNNDLPKRLRAWRCVA